MGDLSMILVNFYYLKIFFYHLVMHKVFFPFDQIRLIITEIFLLGFKVLKKVNTIHLDKG